MARPEIEMLLAKGLVCVKIDTDRTIGGQALFDSTRGERSDGLPWFAIQDGSGKELASCIAPGAGNVGCPYTDEEIAWFLEVLKLGAPALTSEELARIKSTLAEGREEKAR
jgi:hypothetical protein